MYLPNKEDWKTWLSLTEKYRTLVSDTPIINTLMILIALREWSSEPRPPTRIELHSFLFDRAIGESPWQTLFPSDYVTEREKTIRKSGIATYSNSTEHLLLQNLEKIGIVQSETFKTFKKKRTHIKEANPRIFKRTLDQTFMGKEHLYSLTNKGSLYLELVIQTPWLRVSTLPDSAKRGFVPISAISWCYLKDKIRSEDYLKKLPETSYVQNTLRFKNYTLMLSPINRLIMEIYRLNQDLTNLRDRQKEIEAISFMNENTEFEKSIIEQKTNIVEVYLQMLLREAEGFGLSRKLLEKHSPD